MMRTVFILATVLGVFANIGLAAEPTVKRENIEWTQIWVPDLHKTDLPRVLLVGDSICQGYYDGVAKDLQGKAYAAKLATSASLGDPALLEQMKYLLSNYKFDVIHFNNGLHGFDYTEQEYQRDILKLLAMFKEEAPNAKLIWATSTPMRNPANLQEIKPENERVVARNKIAVAIAAQQGIPVDNLYALVVDHPEYWIDDGTHFKPEGQAVQAKQVAKHILEALAK
jgi:lysophospholipase L1-like esterase